MRLLAALFVFITVVTLSLAVSPGSAQADPLDNGPLYLNRFGYDNHDSFALPTTYKPARPRSRFSSFSPSKFLNSNFLNQSLNAPMRRVRSNSFSQFNVGSLNSLRNIGLDDLGYWAEQISNRIINSLSGYLGSLFSIDSAFADLNDLSSGLGAIGNIGGGSSSPDSADFESSERIARRLFQERSAIDHF